MKEVEENKKLDVNPAPEALVYSLYQIFYFEDEKGYLFAELCALTFSE